MTKPSNNKRRFGLSEQTLLALALGAATGFFLGDLAAPLKIAGDVFVQLLLITVIPYIAVSLVSGLGGLSFAEVKNLALKSGGILLLIWGITLILVTMLPLAFPAWPSASFFSESQAELPQAPNFLRLFIPANPFYSMANTIVPAVVVFCILLGVALTGLETKTTLLETLHALRDALVRITGYVSRLAPIGVFALTANTAGTTDFADLARLQIYMSLHALTALLLGLVILPGLVATLTPLRYWAVVRALRTPLITGFATGSPLIVLPLLAQQCKQLMADLRTFDEESQAHADASVGVIIPTAFTFPSPATLMTLFFILFASWYAGSEISPVAYPKLLFAGVPSLFAGSLVTIPFLLDLNQLPSDLFQVFVSVDVIATRFGTFLAVMYYAAIGLLGAMSMQGRVRIRWTQLVRYGVISTVVFIGIVSGVRAFNTHVVNVTYTQDIALQRLGFMESTRVATVVPHAAPANEESEGKPAGLDEIVQRGVLRVCYQPNEYPSAFYTRTEPPQLVGFDIEMAHRLASGLQLQLELIPTQSEREAAQLLDAGVADIYVRSLRVTARRTRMFAFTSPVYMSTTGLIVEDYRRREFETWQQLTERAEPLQLGVEDSPGEMRYAESLFPNAEFVAIEGMQMQREILESGFQARGLDAIVDIAEEGAAWTVLFPSYGMVVPKPSRASPVAYAVARENRDLLLTIDAWLLAEKADGSVDTLYSHWMLGEAMKVDRPPRWSVIRNVLGWVQ